MSSSDDSDSSSEFEDLNSSAEEEQEVHSHFDVEQWVQVIESCSVKQKSDAAVAKGVGVEKLCGGTDASFGESDKAKDGWVLLNDNRPVTVVVSFEKPVFINEIHVYESLNPGSVVKLEMLESSRGVKPIPLSILSTFEFENTQIRIGRYPTPKLIRRGGQIVCNALSFKDLWWTMWQRKTTPEKVSASHRIYKPLLRRYHIQSNTIRVTFDPSHADQIGLQAIKLLGSNAFDITLHQKTLVQSMIELYEQAHKKINTDVQFVIKDKVLHVHRNVLCFRSQYFRSLLLNNFLEKSQAKPIELTDVNHDTFREILYFIYTGSYHSTISYAVAMEAMVYSNKINLVLATRAAMEHISFHLRSNHDLILTVYCFVKKMSPAFDPLLECVYSLCAENLNEICKQKEFGELNKDLMIDIICHATERRSAKNTETAAQNSALNGLFDD